MEDTRPIAPGYTPIPAALIGLRPPRKNLILVVDDEPTNRELISRFLNRKGYDVATANNGEEALAKVRSCAPDLILLDVLMPGMDGLTVCRTLRSGYITRSLPIILVTAHHAIQDRLAGLRAGIDDLIGKPFDLEELHARVEGALQRRHWDQTTQPLTHLPASPVIEEEVWQRLREGTPFAFGYIDIDNFKAFNDVYGYDAGDKVIKVLAASLMKGVKTSSDTRAFAGHVGGDDFVFLSTINDLKTMMPQITAEFDAARSQFYTPRDMEMGAIQTKNRAQIYQTFPLMTLSVAIVSTETRRILHYARLVEVASELKRFIKSQPHEGRSLILWDRRADASEGGIK